MPRGRRRAGGSRGWVWPTAGLTFLLTEDWRRDQTRLRGVFSQFRGASRRFAYREHAQEIILASSFLSVSDSIFGGQMSEQLTLLVLPLELSQQEARAAIDAARVPAATRIPGIRSEAKPRILLVPRLSDRGLAGGGTL